VQAGIARARAVTRPEAPKKVDKAEKEEDQQHRMIVEYDRRSCPELSSMGQSGTAVATRLRAHIRSMEDQDEEKVVGKHFKETHSTREDLVFTSIMTVKVNNPWVRLHFERLFMNQHGGADKFLNYNL
jgi:hypothetical protein